MSGDDDAIVLPNAFLGFVEAMRELTVDGMPDLAIIGGVGVNIRLATSAEVHRATLDVDVVADHRVPGVVEILVGDGAPALGDTVVVRGVSVDVIVTEPVTDHDLSGLDDSQYLFLSGHRFALDTSRAVRITAVDSALTARIAVATPAGLIAAKCHALGYPTTTRRATKHGGDLWDVFRLIEVFDRQGSIRDELSEAPGQLGRLIADVIEREMLTRPQQAAHQMGLASLGEAPSIEQLADVLQPFLEELRAR